jgi:hypothetical protein
MLREVRVGYGRPDMVVVYAAQDILTRRAQALRVRTPLTRAGAVLLSFLVGRRWVSLEGVAGFLRGTSASAARLIEHLEARGLVLTRGESVRARPLNDALAVRRVVACEAKLRSWPTALEQARRHLWFAPTAAQRAAQECREHGIGLVLPDRDWRPTIVVRPDVERARLTPVAWLLNEQLIDRLATGAGAAD